ncbi:MAG: C25 family cysteine peptidase, partial [Candidatus Cloacimonadota bacterium]|nr:C25 family cysteine peptidase [Candidatus Cloacimonadota bacterium]
DTNLEYILLGGDDEIIPFRGVFGQVGNTIDNNMPADLYFSCLDGGWDDNGNGIYGEPADNPDLIPEVAIGRIPAESEEQFQNFFNKTEYYEEVESYSNDIAFMYGENLNWDPVTWGGDYKDEISPYLPEGFHINTRYQRDGNFNPPAVFESINSGLGMINHMGHANYNYLFGFNTGALNQIHNTEYGFAYTQGCYPAAFDDATCLGAECIAEEFITRDMGFFAFVGNTRYGWYSPGNTNGASQAFDHTFFEGLFDENIRDIGNTLNYSKIELLNQALDSSVMRWVYYEMVLFGDPSVEVKDANGTYPYLEPLAYDFSDEIGDNDGNINPGETINLTVSVRNQIGWEDAIDAYIKLSIENEYITVITDSVQIGIIVSGETIENQVPLSFEIDDEQALQDYNFEIELGAITIDDRDFKKTYSSSFSVNLDQLNWPWQSYMNIAGSPVVVDFDNNGTKEVLINDISGSIFFIDEEAESYIDSIYQDYNVRESVAYADLNNDGLLDIISNSLTGKINAIDNNGEIIFEVEDIGNQATTPVIADINNDGSLNIVSFGFDKFLRVLDNTGFSLDNFPIEVAEVVVAEIAVGDINENGFKEVIAVSADGMLHAINHNGEELQNFPVEIGSCTSSPIILDNNLIVIGCCSSGIKIINSNGTILHDIEVESPVIDSPVAADIDDDNELEIIYHSLNNKLFAIEQNGTILDNFPVELNGTFSTPPLVVDINNDEILDIISMSFHGDLFITNAAGIESSLNPIHTNHLSVTPGTVEDLDNDGDFDVVTGYSAGITVVDIKSPKGSKIPWSIYRGNLARTACYSDNQILGNSNHENLPV